MNFVSGLTLSRNIATIVQRHVDVMLQRNSL